MDLVYLGSLSRKPLFDGAIFLGLSPPFGALWAPRVANPYSTGPSFWVPVRLTDASGYSTSQTPIRRGHLSGAHGATVHAGRHPRRKPLFDGAIFLGETYEMPVAEQVPSQTPIRRGHLSGYVIQAGETMWSI